MKRINKCILAFTALLWCAQVFAANLLVNGDFSQVDPTNPETVAPPGWTNVGDVVTENEGVIANSFRGTPAYQRPGQPDTVNFYDFGGNGRGYSTINTGVAQTFATVPGRQYRLTFALSSEFACTDANQTVNTTRVTAGSLSVDVPVPYMPGVVCMQGPAETAAFKKPWVVKTYTFSATGASTTLTFMTTVADDYGSNDPLITGVEVNEISPLLTVNKQLAGSGRLHATDQFVVQIKDANNAVVNDTRNSTTKGTGLTVLDGSGTTGATRLVSGAAYTLAEVMAAGSASLLGSYSPVVACTNANAAGTNVAGINRLGSSVVLAAEDVVTCTVTNAPSVSGNIAGRVFADTGRLAGAANDGVLNGGEEFLAGVQIKLTNCTAVVYSQTLTDAQGVYSFKPPSGLAVGAPLCVVQDKNLASHASTGASVGSAALPSGSPTTVSGTSYTYTRSTDQIAFAWNGTGHADLNFGDVPLSTLVASGTKTAAPGGLIHYAHSFIAGTDGTVVFSVSSAATPALHGWSERVFLDTGCTGTLQSGATQVYPPVGSGLNVVAQQKVCVILQQFVPATAQVGYKNDARLQAAFAYSNANPALSANYTVTDTTQVDNVSLNLFKEVRNVTQNGSFGANNQAKSGDVLEYRITYTNMSPAVLSNLTINDTTPAFTSHVASTLGSTPASLTACTKNTPANPAPSTAVSCTATQAVGGTGAVIWRFSGILPGSASGQVLFQVKVD